MAVEIHLLKLLGEDQPVELAILAYQSSTPAYFGEPLWTATAWATFCREQELAAEIQSRGAAILAGDERQADEVIDLAAFSRLYHRLHRTFGFLRTPLTPARNADPERARLTVGEARILTSGIRFLREFYDDTTWGGAAPQGLVRLVP